MVDADTSFHRRRLPAVVSVIGRSGAGKTTLIETLIPELRKRGHRVGTLKHSGHAGSADRPDKDTFRHVSAGAERSVLSGPGEVALFERREEEIAPEKAVRRFFEGFDLLITEGFKRGPFLKIEVARASVSRDLIAGPSEGLVGVVADFDPPHAVPRFSFDDPASLADFLESTIMTEEERRLWKAVLYVDGKRVPIKGFVMDFLSGSVLGMVDALKGVPESPSRVEILLERKES